MKEYKHDKEQSLNSITLMAMVHCLSSCAVGKIAGMVIGTALHADHSGCPGCAAQLGIVLGQSCAGTDHCRYCCFSSESLAHRARPRSCRCASLSLRVMR